MSRPTYYGLSARPMPGVPLVMRTVLPSMDHMAVYCNQLKIRLRYWPPSSRTIRNSRPSLLSE